MIHLIRRIIYTLSSAVRAWRGYTTDMTSDYLGKHVKDAFGKRENILPPAEAYVEASRFRVYSFPSRKVKNLIYNGRDGPTAKRRFQELMTNNDVWRAEFWDGDACRSVLQR